MNEEEVKYPNVNLKGKRNKQKGEIESADLRYGKNESVEGKNKK